MRLTTFPKVGDSRVVTKFAWLPKIIGSLSGGTLIWLQSYLSHQHYFNAEGPFGYAKWNEMGATFIKEQK